MNLLHLQHGQSSADIINIVLAHLFAWCPAIQHLHGLERCVMLGKPTEAYLVDSLRQD